MLQSQGLRGFRAPQTVIFLFFFSGNGLLRLHDIMTPVVKPEMARPSAFSGAWKLSTVTRIMGVGLTIPAHVVEALANPVGHNTPALIFLDFADARIRSFAKKCGHCELQQ